MKSVCTDSKAYTFCENADRLEIADRAFIHRERKRKSKKSKRGRRKTHIERKLQSGYFYNLGPKIFSFLPHHILKKIFNQYSYVEVLPQIPQDLRT